MKGHEPSAPLAFIRVYLRRPHGYALACVRCLPHHSYAHRAYRDYQPPRGWSKRGYIWNATFFSAVGRAIVGGQR